MSEWTQIKRGKGRKSVQVFEEGYITFSSAPDKNATVESVSRGLAKQKNIWQNEVSRSEVYKILQRLNVTTDPPLINTAVCLALGSLSRDNFRNTIRSMLQLALFLDIVDHMQTISGQSIAMYAQDPSFTAVDNDFLKSLNITVLEHNLFKGGVGPASEHFGPNAFVAEFFMDQGVEHTSSLLCSGTRLLLTTVFGHIERYEASKKDKSEGKRLRTSLDCTYNRYHFPQTQGADQFAYEGLQFMGTKSVDDNDG